ncbi:hypothetical protein GCG21_05715 [Pseudactinotalea sp. HY160]|nr:hypothetical protein [Pseudactinotalea sp. HY160]QGH71028.1 hypothetical protein GCE65_10095 [Pseudactinotalea sp. HY158]
MHSGLTTAKRVVILLAVFFTAFHVFATFLWIAPTSALRDVIPGKVLHNYMIPMFGQSWSVFAPDPINGDYRLQVRAVVETDGQPVETEWVDATAAELTMHMHNLFPPRAAMSANDVASRVKGAFDKLDKDQKDVVALGYYDGDDWRDRMETALRAYDDDGVTRYMKADRLASAYSTQVAYAMWGEDVTQVQFSVSRQNVVPYEKRNDPEAERPGVQAVPIGWRGLVEEPGQSRENFAEIFLTGVEESGR